MNSPPPVPTTSPKLHGRPRSCYDSCNYLLFIIIVPNSYLLTVSISTNSVLMSYCDVDHSRMASYLRAPSTGHPGRTPSMTMRGKTREWQAVQQKVGKYLRLSLPLPYHIMSCVRILLIMFNDRHICDGVIHI
jgi:hypothetical protein